jgi:hypothetical protein
MARKIWELMSKFPVSISLRSAHFHFIRWMLSNRKQQGRRILRWTRKWNFCHVFSRWGGLDSDKNNIYKYCHELGSVTIAGVWIGYWIYWPLYTSLGTTSNYSVTAYLHNSQITASTKPFSSLLVFSNSPLATASSSGDSSASVVTPLPAG